MQYSNRNLNILMEEQRGAGHCPFLFRKDLRMADECGAVNVVWG